jgi:hypothetical protein
MHKIVELERINFATIPAIELHAKLAEGFTQVAIVRDPRPFSDQAFNPFRNFLHRFVWLTTVAHSRRSVVHISGSIDSPLGRRRVQPLLGISHVRAGHR